MAINGCSWLINVYHMFVVVVHEYGDPHKSDCNSKDGDVQQ